MELTDEEIMKGFCDTCTDQNNCKTENTIPISPSSGLPVKPEGYIRL